MNVYVVTSGEIPFRKYVFPISEEKAAQLLLTVMQRNGRPAAIGTVSSHIIAADIINGHIAPEGWNEVLRAQRAL